MEQHATSCSVPQEHFPSNCCLCNRNKTGSLLHFSKTKRYKTLGLILTGIPAMISLQNFPHAWSVGDQPEGRATRNDELVIDLVSVHFSVRILGIH